MHFTKIFSILALGATAVCASSAASKADVVAARTPNHVITVNANANVAVNVTGVGEALGTILRALGGLENEGGNIIDRLLLTLLEGGSGAINETAIGIAHVLGETPAVANALSTILGTIDVCVN